MIQYGYANFGKKGYRIASKNAFFHSGSPEREQAFYKLMQNVSGSTQNKVCYLGITTDLGISSENPRFYFQRSGQETARSADFAQGYVWNVKENYIFGRDFPQILRLQFMEQETLCGLPVQECGDAFPDIALADASFLPEDFCAALLDSKILGEILERLLEGQKVLLRLNRKGEEADRLARKVLLQVYECLPYGVRERAGFCTNVTAVRFEGEEEDRLAQSVCFCLADSDAELPDSIAGYTVLEMEKPPEGKCRETKREEFLRFLLEDEKREDYFEHLFSEIEERQDGKVSLQLYQDYFYLLYRMPKKRREKLSDEEVFEWCEWYDRNRLGNDRIKEIFLETVQESLTKEEMQNFLWNKDVLKKLLPSHVTGQRLAKLSQYTREAEKVFALFEDICKKYLPDPQDGMRGLGNVLVEPLLKWTGADMLIEGCKTGPDPENGRSNLEYLKMLVRLTEAEKNDQSVLGLAWGEIHSYLQSFLGEAEEANIEKERRERGEEEKLLSEFARDWKRKILGDKLQLLLKLEKGEYSAAGQRERFYGEAAEIVQKDWEDGEYGGTKLLRNLPFCCELAQLRKESVQALVETLWRVDLLDKIYCEELLKRRREWEMLAAIMDRKAELYYDTKLLIRMEVKEAVFWLDNLFQQCGREFTRQDAEGCLEQKKDTKAEKRNPEDVCRMEEPVSEQTGSLEEEEKQNRDGALIERFWAAGTVLLVCELAAALWVVFAWFWI